MIRTFLLFSVIVTAASAGTVTMPFAQVTGSNLTPATGSLSATITNETALSYIVTGTACFDGYCQGQLPGPGPAYPVNDPLTLRLTGLTITCNSTGASCGPITVVGLFNWNQSAGVDNVFVNLDGTASAPGQTMTVFTNAGAVSLSNLVAATGGVFNNSFSLGTTPVGSLSKVTLGLTITLAQNQSISLPNSLSLVFTPEPGTLAIALGGLVAIGFLRRKR